jgi:disulfide bond formation protein DsbB
MEHNHIERKSKNSYYQNLKVMITKNIATWHNYRRFWLSITLFCVVVIILSCFLFDNFLGVAACEEFALIRISLLVILAANTICIISPKKLASRVIGYGCGFVGAIWGLKNSCFLWAIYQISNVQNYMVPKKSLFDAAACILSAKKDCGLDNGTIISTMENGHLYNIIEKSHDNTLVIVSQSTFMYALSVYMLIFTFILLILYSTFVCSAIKKKG